MKIKNSLSTFLEQAMILNANSLESIDKINDAVTSKEDTIKLVLTDPNDGSTVEYYIPSFGYLKSEIERLSKSLETMTNISDGAGSKVRLSDGTYRKIIASKIPSEAPTITTVENITNFNFKSNWFFEDMLNPCLYVNWDMSNQISSDTERVMIQRYMLKCDTQQKIDVFNNNFKGRNDIVYKDFLSTLMNYGIKYTLDDEIKDLPPRSKRYYGTFSVIRITSESDAEGNSVKRYILDSLEFTDSRSGFENTRLLTVGDYVEVNSSPASTRYKVIYADSSEKKIGLKLIEGSEGVKIGANTLKISASQDTSVSADIPIGFDEREVIFVKAIDPDSNIPSNKWSPGVGFYSNELTYVDGNGTTQTLQKFYQKNVIDFGQVLLSYASDYYPSIREGITPNKPVLNYSSGEGDFKIVQINNQLTETVDSESFRSLIAEKSQVQSELSNISNEISKQKELIQTTQYTSTTEKLKAQSTLDSLIENQETLTANYNSIVNNIKAKYSSSSSATPKYRVRGFWNIPDPKVSSSSGTQEIIKFKIRYRYLSESGNANPEEEFTYTSGGIKVVGRFSNWNEIETKTRPRIKTTSGWEWEAIDTADPDAVNINQMDIPINAGEQVEIQVKSVSEAGWPSNPMESDWSDSIIVAFADFSELQADDVSEIVEQNRIDAAVASVQKAYSSTTEHMNSSFYTNDKYFAHTAESITSGFLSPEQTPITLYDKLQELQSQIDAIIEQINGTVGDINVVLVDNSDEEKIYTLNEGSTTYINAGDYTSALKTLYNDDNTAKRGAIVTKTYYLDISTDAQSGLYLLSKLSGNRTSMCPCTIKNSDLPSTSSECYGNDYDEYDNIITKTTSSSDYYNEIGRYDLVPINLTSPEIIDFQIGSPNMYQSAQCRGQFVYSRFRNIGDTFDMYANAYSLEAGTTNEINPVFDPECKFLDSEIYGYNHLNPESFDDVKTLYQKTTGTEEFSGTGIDDSTNEYTYKSSMYDILNRITKTWSKTDTATQKLLSNAKILLRKTFLTDAESEQALKIAKKLNSRISNLTNENASSSYTVIPKIQAAYGFADMGNYVNTEQSGVSTKIPLSTFDADPTYMTTHKIGYEDRDKYAIGANTCTSYLFLSPVNHSEIQVDGDSTESSKFVKNGESLRVPIVYQYRMTDYNYKNLDDTEINSGKGAIFGNTSLTEESSTVKNAKFANIIGIDIWTEKNALRPKQYDIVVYSTYGSTINVNTGRTKTSNQALIDVSKTIAAKLEKLATDSKNLTGKNTSK